ncbi:MAG: thioredoxin domain-containing protein [Candidatus Pacebacteria bacterium]|jgi:protein-disulfide isomerase|nr:disulfide bond formation protein DsbA [bacterium]MDP6527448.1 thioredoxin domain-containing protein [Candidatus Paceibacterota bacterium]MDP6659646.1 thioredoxin domain-containing protein [Candidatus Paceibacterota bacterium]|tara:strand:+ start:3983 stop:4705 length:723 start_codon:yes stop_codon:yes gene_type:complete
MGENKLTIPIAVIVAGALIGGAIYLTNRTPSDKPTDTDIKDEPQVPAVNADDHILGNPEAPIVFVEYSDFECPFCKDFHNSMHQIIDKYGADGTVAWVYRHFPIAQLHSKATIEAEATECAADVGGNDGFWAYADRLFEVTPSNNGLNLDRLPEIAEEVGLDRNEFEKCLDDRKFRKEVSKSYQEAVDSGARGTPHTVIIVGDEQVPIEGAQPFSSLDGFVQSILNDGGFIGVPTIEEEG